MKIRGRIFTISNFLSFSRIIIVWPIAYYLMQNTAKGNMTAFILMLIGACTDFMDGYLARALNQQSDLGRIIDPIADKVSLGLLGIILTQTSGLPVWFLILIIARDLAILLLGLKMIAKQDSIPESNWSGKIAVTGIAVVVILYTLGLSPWREAALWITVFLLLYSIVNYFRRYLAFLQAQKI
ncbi:MAG: CDP-alcohol phosphatidyltransferase family protein [Deferribacteres bacterium]|nr:CDP-alcohol phosphatidyltransferase family protein [candidate division KSB1 bacterium]MCB9503329.1 CDP-alcohol phosphatidyltransferase family protein [Deferribacteres bacterium]